MTTQTSPTASGAAMPMAVSPSGIQDNRQANVEANPLAQAPAGANLPAGQRATDAHLANASGDQTTQPTMRSATPMMGSSAGPDFRSGHPRGDAQTAPAAAEPTLPDDHMPRGAQPIPAVGEPNPPALAKGGTQPSEVAPVLASDSRADQSATEAHNTRVGTGQTPPATSQDPTPKLHASLADPLLALLADALDDLERTRIANENRLRQLTRSEADSDGEERGFGLTLDQPQVAALANVVDALGKLERDSTLNLQRALRKHPLGPWVKRTVGVGEKQGARLLAAIGDPYWNTLHDRPRTVSELWAYCGLHVLPAAQYLPGTQGPAGGGGKQGDPDHEPPVTHGEVVGVAPTRARGQRANWSSTAKMRAYLIAESCIKQARSPYRAVYDDGRTKYADSLHAAECRRCGPSGKPAAIGSPISAGHQHARAMRLVMKALLRDLWLEAKSIHEEAAR